MQTPYLAVINSQINPVVSTPAQQRAICFVSARIADADASQWYGGYIHGLIQSLIVVGAITVKQGGELEYQQEYASCQALNRRAVENAPRRAVGGAA